MVTIEQIKGIIEENKKDNSFTIENINDAIILSQTDDKFDILIKCISIPDKIISLCRLNDNIIRLEEDDRWIIAGYASVDAIDLVKDEIPLSTLKESLDRFMKVEDSRNLMLEHSSTQIGEIIPKWNSIETKVDDRGLFIIAEIRKDIESATDTWDHIKNKDLNSFSVKVEVLKPPRKVCKEDGECWDVLEECNLVEISVVKNPANPESLFDVVD